MMKKASWKNLLQLFNLPVIALCMLLVGCTSLSYVDDDYAEIKRSNIQTDEMFSITVYEKPTGFGYIKAGISETVLENALVLYVKVKNNTDSVYKFDTADITVTSPIGEVSVIPPSQYTEAYLNYEAANYTNLAGATAQLSQIANIQNQYRRTQMIGDSRLENNTIAPEFAQLENTISGIQAHTLTSYKFIDPNSEEYYYIFLRKPDEYPIVVKYKDLTYKFGGKKNVHQQ